MSESIENKTSRNTSRHAEGYGLTLRRITTVALMATAVSLAATAPRAHAEGPAQATDYRFGVYYNDKRIGEHDYQVVEDGGTTKVRSRAEFQVKVLFVTAYRYRHQANELWRDGCLAGLSSVTDDNGERFEVHTERREPGLQLTRLEPSRNVVSLDQPCPASFAYWDRSRLQHDGLINAQDGEVYSGRLVEEGREIVDGLSTVRYRLDTEGLGQIKLWYRESDGAWVRLETQRSGATLQYRLESMNRTSVSGIEQDARVQDPPGI